jgi:hypothetical protein
MIRKPIKPRPNMVIKKILVATVLLISSFCLTACDPRELPGIKDKVIELEKNHTAQAEEAIRNKTELQEINNLCNQIPLLGQTKFIWKNLFKNKNALDFYFYYEGDLHKLNGFYKNHFDQKGWKLTKDITSYPQSSEFKASNYRVVIQYGGISERTNFAITCEKLHSESNN